MSENPLHTHYKESVNSVDTHQHQYFNTHISIDTALDVSCSGPSKSVSGTPPSIGNMVPSNLPSGVPFGFPFTVPVTRSLARRPMSLARLEATQGGGPHQGGLPQGGPP